MPRRRTAVAALAALAAALIALFARPGDAQRTSPFELETRVERRWDGEPYRLWRFRVPLDRARIRVVDARMGRRFARLLRGGDLVVNGGFYAPDRTAEGLVVVDGEELNPFLPRIGGGVLAVSNGRATLHDAEAPLSLPTPLDFAVQCRPRLVVDGRNNIARRTPQTAARTALCVRDGGRTLDVVVARRVPSRGRAGPTLFTLGALLAESGCEQALNLDGGPSTGVAWRSRRGPRAIPPERGVRHAIVFEATGGR